MCIAKSKKQCPFLSPRPALPFRGESHSFITLYLSRGSLYIYKHQCQLSSKQPAFPMQGRGGHVSDRALLEGVPALSMKIGSPAQQFQLWHSVWKIEIRACQDGDWRIFINAFLWWPKKREKEKEINWMLVREMIVNELSCTHSMATLPSLQRWGSALLSSCYGETFLIYFYLRKERCREDRTISPFYKIMRNSACGCVFVCLRVMLWAWRKMGEGRVKSKNAF